MGDRVDMLADASSDRQEALLAHPLIDAVVPGGTAFEWLEGGRFLTQRSYNDHELFPDATCAIDAGLGSGR